MWDLERLKEWAKPALAYPELVTIARLARSARQAKNLALVFAIENGLEEEIAKACRWLMIIGRDHGRDVLEQYIKKESSEEMGKNKKLPTEGSFVAIMREIEGRPHILLSIREDGQGLNLIGGRVEDGETHEACAVREALEETGLNVEVFDQIGEDLPMRDPSYNEASDIARVYRAKWVSGTLKTTKKSVGFRWVSDIELHTAGVVERPCYGYRRGRTYAMAESALQDSEVVYSKVSDPKGLGMVSDLDQWLEEMSVEKIDALINREWLKRNARTIKNPSPYKKNIEAWASHQLRDAIKSREIHAFMLPYSKFITNYGGHSLHALRFNDEKIGLRIAKVLHDGLYKRETDVLIDRKRVQVAVGIPFTFKSEEPMGGSFETFTPQIVEVKNGESYSDAIRRHIEPHGQKVWTYAGDLSDLAGAFYIEADGDDVPSELSPKVLTEGEEMALARLIVKLSTT